MSDPGFCLCEDATGVIASFFGPGEYEKAFVRTSRGWPGTSGADRQRVSTANSLLLRYYYDGMKGRALEGLDELECKGTKERYWSAIAEATLTILLSFQKGTDEPLGYRVEEIHLPRKLRLTEAKLFFDGTGGLQRLRLPTGWTVDGKYEVRFFSCNDIKQIELPSRLKCREVYLDITNMENLGKLGMPGDCNIADTFTVAVSACRRPKAIYGLSRLRCPKAELYFGHLDKLRSLTVSKRGTIRRVCTYLGLWTTVPYDKFVQFVQSGTSYTAVDPNENALCGVIPAIDAVLVWNNCDLWQSFLNYFAAADKIESRRCGAGPAGMRMHEEISIVSDWLVTVRDAIVTSVLTSILLKQVLKYLKITKALTSSLTISPHKSAKEDLSLSMHSLSMETTSLVNHGQKPSGSKLTWMQALGLAIVVLVLALELVQGYRISELRAEFENSRGSVAEKTEAAVTLQAAKKKSGHETGKKQTKKDGKDDKDGNDCTDVCLPRSEFNDFFELYKNVTTDIILETIRLSFQFDPLINTDQLLTQQIIGLANAIGLIHPTMPIPYTEATNQSLLGNFDCPYCQTVTVSATPWWWNGMTANPDQTNGGVKSLWIIQRWLARGSLKQYYTMRKFEISDGFFFPICVEPLQPSGRRVMTANEDTAEADMVLCTQCYALRREQYGLRFWGGSLDNVPANAGPGFDYSSINFFNVPTNVLLPFWVPLNTQDRNAGGTVYGKCPGVYSSDIANNQNGGRLTTVPYDKFVQFVQSGTSYTAVDPNENALCGVIPAIDAVLVWNNCDLWQSFLN
eukprot:g62702.t1